MTIDERVRELGLVLPEPFRSPTGAAYPFSWVRVRGNRAYISGHLPLQPNGTLAEPPGKVGDIIDRARRSRGTTGRPRHAWEPSAGTGRTGANHGVVTGTGHGERLARNNAGGSGHQRVLGIDLGRVRKGTGAHSRSAVGMAELPFSVPVEVEAEVEVSN